jgi:hypothetical protein
MGVLHDQQPGILGRGGRLYGEPPTNDQLVRIRQVMRPTLRIKDQFRTNSVVRRWLANIPGRAAVSPWRLAGGGGGFAHCSAAAAQVRSQGFRWESR